MNPGYSKLAGLAIAAMLLSGCATEYCCTVPTHVIGTPVVSPYVSPALAPPLTRCVTANCVPPPPIATVATPTKFTAVGYGAEGAYTRYTHAQQRLMAMRAAQVDAYRNLAEQVYGFRVWGNTSVSAFATQSDNIRTYVDAFIRGAKVINTTSIADGNYEVTVELEMTPQFYGCIKTPGTCGMPVPASVCATPGCSQPSTYYISN
jgi:outer membrane protein FlgP